MRCRFIAISFLLALPLFLGAEEVISLGDTPWKFTKVENEGNNLALQGTCRLGNQLTKVFTDGEKSTSLPLSDQTSKEITIDLHQLQPLERTRVFFQGDQLRYLQLRIEASKDSTEWQTLFKEQDSHPCELFMEGNFFNVNNTVGYVEKATSTTLTLPTQGAYRYLRLTFHNGSTENKESCPIVCSEIHVLSGSQQLPDQQITALEFDDSSWQTVGIPHCYNEQDTYLNASTGERCWRGEAWYRKRLFFNGKERGKNIYLEFKGVNIGATVYLNGHAFAGNTKVDQPGTVTHVGSYLPFTVDITPYIRWGEENQLAIKVSNARGTFFTWPGFSVNEGFGQAMGGIVCPVYLHKKQPVHIPFNSYSPQSKWGTYYGTVAANKERAVLRFQTQVENQSSQPQPVELRTYLKDAKGHTVLHFNKTSTIPAGGLQLFDHLDSISQPHLWFPVGCSGEPYLYTVYCEVRVKGKLMDTHREEIGVRTITWDADHCYVNGERCILRGFGNRNIYPGLGAALPTDFKWEDIARIARCGGNTLRIGHQPPFAEAFEASDHYGVLLIVNSGDDEWALKNEPALTYKREYDRDMLIAFRNHPSVVLWESNNGLAYDGEKYYPSYTLEEVMKWDSIQPRLVLNRDGYPPRWNKENPVVVGYTNRYEKVEGSPSFNMEVYGTNWSGLPSWCIARFDYANEKEFSMDYVQNYLDNVRNRACGWIDWMLAETYGEGYTIYLNGMRNQKSLGSCAMDANRFPKLKYRIYQKALWVPFEKQPGVALQSHWNFSGLQEVDAWSNCPFVELFVNNRSYGVVEPDSLTRRCTWKEVPWEAGTLRAVGMDTRRKPVCSEQVHSAGEPYAIRLKVEKSAPKPDGTKFRLKANGSDAFVVTATVVDKEGHWCPFADERLHFTVEGEGVYKGSYNFYVTPDKSLTYHAPGDPELQAEGGLMRVAVRTTFKPGKIKVKVEADGLKPGETTVRSF